MFLRCHKNKDLQMVGARMVMRSNAPEARNTDESVNQAAARSTQGRKPRTLNECTDSVRQQEQAAQQPRRRMIERERADVRTKMAQARNNEEAAVFGKCDMRIQQAEDRYAPNPDNKAEATNVDDDPIEALYAEAEIGELYDDGVVQDQIQEGSKITATSPDLAFNKNAAVRTWETKNWYNLSRHIVGTSYNVREYAALEREAMLLQKDIGKRHAELTLLKATLKSNWRVVNWVSTFKRGVKMGMETRSQRSVFDFNRMNDLKGGVKAAFRAHEHAKKTYDVDLRKLRGLEKKYEARRVILKDLREKFQVYQDQTEQMFSREYGPELATLIANSKEFTKEEFAQRVDGFRKKMRIVAKSGGYFQSGWVGFVDKRLREAIKDKKLPADFAVALGLEAQAPNKSAAKPDETRAAEKSSSASESEATVDPLTAQTLEFGQRTNPNMTVEQAQNTQRNRLVNIRRAFHITGTQAADILKNIYETLDATALKKAFSLLRDGSQRDKIGALASGEMTDRLGNKVLFENLLPHDVSLHTKVISAFTNFPAISELTQLELADRVRAYLKKTTKRKNGTFDGLFKFLGSDQKSRSTPLQNVQTPWATMAANDTNRSSINGSTFGQTG